MTTTYQRNWRWLSWHKGGDIDFKRDRGLLATFGVGFDLTMANRPVLRFDWWDESELGGFGVSVGETRRFGTLTEARVP